MSATRFKNIPVADMLPLPEVPEAYGPRNREEARIMESVQRGFDSPAHEYKSAEAFIDEIRALSSKLAGNA